MLGLQRSEVSGALGYLPGLWRLVQQSFCKSLWLRGVNSIMGTFNNQPSHSKNQSLDGRHLYGNAMRGVWLVIATLALGVLPTHAQVPQTRFNPPKCSGATRSTGGQIEGLVPLDIDLSDDTTARAIVAQGFVRLREACPSRKGLTQYWGVFLYHGKIVRPGDYAVEAASTSYAGREAEVLGPGEERYRNKVADERKRQEEKKKREALAGERTRKAEAEAVQREQALAQEKKIQEAISKDFKEKTGLDCKYKDEGNRFGKEIIVRCDVAPNVDLSRDEIARAMFTKIQEQTRHKYQVDPFRVIFKQDGKIAIETLTNSFTNYARKRRETAEYHQYRQAFLLQHKVLGSIIQNIDGFMANPFAYEGKRIALHATLSTMLSPTDGVFLARIRQEMPEETDGILYRELFVSSDEFFFVSEIPKGSITSTDVVLIVGEVIGKTTLERMGKKVSVPHLDFVGVDKCTLDKWQHQKCN